MKTPTSRAQALRIGATRYYTGKPCKHGHVAYRQAVSGNCTECLKTVHAGARREAGVRALPQKMAYRHRINDETRERAVNGRQQWLGRDAHLVTLRDAQGEYVYTNSELVEMLGRSMRSIERARWRFRQRLQAGEA